MGNNLKRKLYELNLKFTKFMYGRYGTDDLNKFLGGMVLALWFMSWFFGDIWFLFAVIAMVWLYYRTFSKNINARYNENIKFLGYTKGIRKFINTQKLRFAQRKTHHIYQCPICGQQIRIPRGKGKVEITCPSCRNHFIRVS